MKEKIAALVTFVFDPTVTLPLFLSVLIFKTGLTPAQIKVILPLVLLTCIILPGLLWFFSLKERWISDWEMTKRRERFNLYSIFCVFWFLGVLIAYVFGTGLLTNLYLIFALAFFAATMVTWFWKISLHMLIDTTIISILEFIFGGFWYLYFLLPIIAWSRYVRHKHTPAQLLGGFSLAMAIVYGSFIFFGYL